MRRTTRAIVWLSATVLTLFFLALLAFAWMLTTESGLRAAVRLVAAMSDGRLHVGSVQGVLAGGEWHDLEYADSTGLTIRIKSLRVQAVSREVFVPRLHVAVLQVDGFELDLPAPQPRPPRTAPLDLPSRLPIDVIVDSLVLTQASFKQGGVEFLHLDRAEANARWLGEEIEIVRLASGFQQSGPLEFHARLSMHDDLIDIAELVVKGPGELQASGKLGLEKSQSDLELQWRGARWPLVTPDTPPGIADVAGEAHFTGLLGDYRFELTANAVVQKIPAKLEARGAGSLREVRIEHAHLQADQGSADLRGNLAWAPALRADVDGTIRNLNPAVFAPDWPGSINGTVVTRTTVRDGQPDIAFELAIAPSKLRGETFAATARGRASVRSARFEELIVKTGGGSLKANGDVAWQPALAGNLDAELAGLNPGVFLPGWPGKLNGTAKVRTDGRSQPTAMDGGSAARGRMPEPPVDLRFDVEIKNSELRGYPLIVSAHGNWRAPALVFETLTLQSGDTRLTASGQATPPFDLSGRLQSPNLVALHPDAAGELTADLKLRGPLERPHLVARANGRALRFRAWRAGTLTLEADVDPLVPSHVDLTLANADFGVGMPSAKLGIKGIERWHTLTLDAHTERGDVTLTADGGYDRKRYEWGGYLTATRLAPKDLPEWQLEKSTPVLLGRKRQSIEPACLAGGAGRGCVSLEQNVTGQGLRLYWDLKELQLATFKPLLPPDTQVTGEANGDGYIEIAGGDVAAIEAEMRLTGARIERPGMPVFEVLPSKVKADQRTGRLHAVADFKLAQGAIAADVTAEPGGSFAERALSGQIRIDVPDLAFVEHFSSQLRGAGGRINGALALGGTAGRPRLRGDVVLADGHTRLVTPGIEIQQVQLRLSGSGEGPLALDGAMRSGDGTVSLKGSVDPAQAPPRADVTLKGENFQAVATPDARIWVTPDLHLVSDDTGIHLDGDLKVPRAEITPRKGVGDQGVSVSADQVMVGVEPKEPATPLKIYTTVKLVLGDQVSFKGFGLTTQLGGSVTLYEEPLRETSAQGTLYLTSGRYKAYGQNLNIESGRLIFDGGPVTKPAVDLYATRRPQSDVTVGVRVRGTLNRPELSLQSDPPMAREEQLSWLVLGRPLDASSASDRSALTQAALSLGLTGGDYFAQRLGKGVGLDTLTIGSSYGGSAVAADAGTIQGSQASMNRGAYQDQTQAAQLTLGKYLTPKLFVSYGVSLFQQGQTFRLQYDLGRGFKLQSEAGVASGADLIYTFERGK